MELKQDKPIHLRCPKCGYDFAYNANHVEERIDQLKEDISSIMAQMKDFKASNPANYFKSDWYRKAKSALSYKQADLVKAKKARKATAEEIKRQQNIIFYKLVCERIGKDEALKLMKEAEEELVYYEWDMATQTFTRFDGV